MSTSTAKSDYLLLFRGNVWDKGLSPAQTSKSGVGLDGLVRTVEGRGKVHRRASIGRRRQSCFGQTGRTVADGPFAESKEAIGGYFYLTVADENEAVEIAKQCPGLEYGSVVEVRPVAEDCSIKQRAEEYSPGQLAGATA